jgi:hypothetical protein
MPRSHHAPGDDDELNSSTEQQSRQEWAQSLFQIHVVNRAPLTTTDFESTSRFLSSAQFLSTELLVAS